MSDFKGPDYDPKLDKDRLTKQIDRIREVMTDGKYRTLREVSEITGDPEASVSAQIRHLRRPCFGAHERDKQRRGGESSGTWEYTLLGPGTAVIDKTRIKATKANKKNWLEAVRQVLDSIDNPPEHLFDLELWLSQSLGVSSPHQDSEPEDVSDILDDAG